MPLSYPARTWLFVPAHRRAIVPKALASAADVVVFDLEDSVPVAEKAAARATLVDTLAKPSGRAVVVRVTADALSDDLDAALQPGVVGIVIPKATPELVHRADARADERGANVIFVPIVEDPVALDGVESLAAASQRVQFLAFGPLDFASSVGLDPTEAEDSLDHARQHVVLASARARLLAPIDGPVVKLADPDRVRQRALRSKCLGFQGMLLIHPEQIAPVREAYRPSADEVEAARRIVELYEDAYRRGIGAVRIDDRMIDAANVGTYRRILEEARPAT